MRAEHYRLCANPKCEVVYFSSETTQTFTQEDLQVPVGFKDGADPKYICYCAKVTEGDIYDAILNQGAETLNEVLKVTGGLQNCNCEQENPSGKCCATNFYEVVWEALQSKQNQR